MPDDPLPPPEDPVLDALPEDEHAEDELEAADAVPAPVGEAKAEPEIETESEPEPVPIAETRTGTLPEVPRGTAPKRRPDLADRREPLYRECRGYRLRLDPPDLARLRELPGSRGKSDTEIGEAFFDGQAERLAASIVDDVPSPNELRVVVDPYSRQAFLALENRIRGILSF